MAEARPITEEWRQLYRLAGRVREISPWNRMTEMDVFGVQNPETGVIGFVSVMGMENDHFAVTMYQGIKALYDFWDFQDTSLFDAPERVMEIPQLQVSFEDRSFLERKDRQIIKRLGLSFKGRQAWPMFRSMRPGFLPWYLNGSEARFLAYALEQTLEINSRFEKDDYLLDFDEGDDYLVRVPVKKGNSLVWEDKIMEVPPPSPEPIPITVDRRDLDNLRNVSKGSLTLEIDFFIFPVKVGDNTQRPSLPYLLMVVESKSGMVVGHETFLADPSLEDMWGKVPGALVHQFSKTGIIPGEIRVRSGLLYALLQPIAEELRFRLRQNDYLPSLDEAKEELLHFML